MLEKARRAPGSLTRVLTRGRGTKFPLCSRRFQWIFAAAWVREGRPAAGGRQGWVNGTGWCTMDAMTSFDAELVDLWFGRALDSNHPLMPFWGIHPTDEESTVIVDGRRQVQAAIGPSRQDSTPESVPESSPVRPTELAARMLQSYLSAVAAGVAETRRTLAGVGADTAPGGEPIGDPGSLALVAGLNAGAAALYGEFVSTAYRPAGPSGSMEPTAAESARLAGVSAAELVVDGADLHQIAGAAAGVARGWRVGLPENAQEQADYRVRALVGLLLVALEHVTRKPEPAAEPASCGAGPGENAGHSFPAEITFQIGVEPGSARSLAAELRGLADEVAVWVSGDGSWYTFHVHTDRPGEVVGQVYACGTAFDLQITDRG